MGFLLIYLIYADICLLYESVGQLQAPFPFLLFPSFPFSFLLLSILSEISYTSILSVINHMLTTFEFISSGLPSEFQTHPCVFLIFPGSYYIDIPSWTRQLLNLWCQIFSSSNVSYFNKWFHHPPICSCQEPKNHL